MKRIGLLLLAAVLAVGIVHYNRRAAREEAYLLEFHSAVQELEYHRSALEQELYTLERRQNDRSCGMGILLFERPEERLYTQVLPVMEEFGLTGAVVLTPEEYPGAPGCITVEQMTQLQEAGWVFCAGWDGSRTLSELQKPFTALKLSKTKTVCVRSGAFREDTASRLNSAGYTVVFHHGETESLLSRQSKGSKHRRIGAVLWNDPEILTWLDAAMTQYGLLAISVDFSTQYGDFEEVLFRNMCRILQDNSNHFLLVDLTEPTEAERQAEAYSRARRIFLRAEIKRYEQEIEKVYELYRQYGAELPRE